MRISTFLPQGEAKEVVEEEPEIDFEVELSSLNFDDVANDIPVEAVEKTDEDVSLEDAVDKPAEDAAFRLNEFIQSYKSKLDKKDLRSMSPKYIVALKAYNYLDEKECADSMKSTQYRKAA